MMDATAVAAAAAAAAANGTNVQLSAEDKARYEAARKELMQALQKKRLVDRQLAQLEVQIYNFEGSYLSETAQHSGGNIIQGFDGYLKTQSVGRRRHEPTDADRVFSNSSLSYQRSLELLTEGVDDPDIFSPSSSTLISIPNANTNSRGPTPGLTSIVLPPPTSGTPSTSTSQKLYEGQGGSQTSQQQLTAAQQKKMRDKEYQRRKRATAAREKERNAQMAAQAAAAAAQVQAHVQAQVQAHMQAQGGVEGSSQRSGSVVAEGDGAAGMGDSGSVSGVSTARGRMSKKPRQADDD